VPIKFFDPEKWRNDGETVNTQGGLTEAEAM
jgi:hypothetical protein